MDQINIVCLKWGTKYGPEYVNRLYLGVKRNTTKSFKFWCFTDDTTGLDPMIKTVPLFYANQLDSWWNKLNLFSNNIPIPIGEHIFYIDLDTVIVKNIDDILSVKTEKLILLRDFYFGIVKSANKFGSGLMCWQHGNFDFIWKDFIKNYRQHVKEAGSYGDQWWIEKKTKDVMFWQDLFPEEVVSFKIHCRKGLPQAARIICYHGRPSIPQSINEVTVTNKWTIQPQSWVSKYWKD